MKKQKTHVRKITLTTVQYIRHWMRRKKNMKTQFAIIQWRVCVCVCESGFLCIFHLHNVYMQSCVLVSVDCFFFNLYFISLNFILFHFVGFISFKYYYYHFWCKYALNRHIETFPSYVKFICILF